MHAVGTVPGLHLQVLPSGGRSWVLRVTVGEHAGNGAQRRREIGLGGYPEVTLAMAHEKARAVRGQIRQGRDPVVERSAARKALRQAASAEITFSEAAKRYIAIHEGGWRNAKHVAQWRSTLETYAAPVMGTLSIRDVSDEHVRRILEPIWASKTETAVRLRGRIEKVLDWAIARRYRDGPNPARWKGHLETMLAMPSKVAVKDHHQALVILDVPEFMAQLRGQHGIGARALELAILTAARSGEVRGAKWDEFELIEGIWTIPAARMKAGKEHRVPLSGPALALLKKLDVVKDEALVFPSPRGGQLSDMTLTAVLRRLKIPAVPHGFRSTFRDWAAEKTDHAREVAEMALAHAIESKVEAAYRRGDLIQKRRLLMEDWAAFCAGKDNAVSRQLGQP